ncbi:MAG: 50S ribosomal protein L11 methyltransferase [Desulfuromonadia bacterium]
MTQTWYEIRCTVPADEADRLAELLSELTGNGACAANLDVDAFSLESIQLPSHTTVTAYVESAGIPTETIETVRGFLREIGDRTGTPPPDPEIAIVRDEDWANGWKEWFKPALVGERTVVKPTWEEYEAAAGEIVIEIDPGQAFGTGTHETTRLCIGAIERLVAAAPGGSVLDVGTGSGILAIAAILHGARHAEGIDIDPLAIETARENARHNGVGSTIILHTTPLDQIDGRYDLVVANILAEDLVRMRHDIARRVGSPGFLLLSGILTEKEEYVREGFRDAPLSFVRSTTMGEWSALLYHRG